MSRIALQLTDRIKYRWPPEYCAEFIRKATKKGHDVFVIADEPRIRLDMKGEHIFDRTKERAEDVLESCDVFVGPPLRLADIAKRRGLKQVRLLGASLEGVGVQSTTFCAGCEQKMDPRIDCLWGDEICMSEITANDVLEAIC
jgi:ADP-heptose:LPS heptosyltransferase